MDYSLELDSILPFTSGIVFYPNEDIEACAAALKLHMLAIQQYARSHSLNQQLFDYLNDNVHETCFFLCRCKIFSIVGQMHWHACTMKIHLHLSGG
jgi:hypothetical protein